VECSSCHTLALTNLGSVYSCGDGSHGQLGHGSLESQRHLRLLTSFIDSNGEMIVINQLSAGSDDASSHSAAIDTNNNLFTWGKSIICGHLMDDASSNGKVQSHSTLPRKLKALEVRQGCNPRLQY